MGPPELVRGFIYVEAYKQTHVKAAIEDISNLKMGLWKQEVRAPTACFPS
jgi:transcription elongation factor SPT5